MYSAKFIALVSRDLRCGLVVAAALLLAACDQASIEVQWSAELLRNEPLKAGSYLGITLDGVSLVRGERVIVCLFPQAGAAVTAQGIVLDRARETPPFAPELGLVTPQGEVALMRPIPAAQATEAAVELCYEPAAPLKHRDYTMLRLTTPVSFTVQRLVWKSA